MLKFIVLSFSFVFFTTAIYANSVSLVPNKPVDCLTYNGPIEIIHNAKIIKNDDKAIVKFYGAFGRCEDRKKRLTPLKKYVKINVWNEGINGPWNYFRGEVNLTKLQGSASGKTYVFKVELTMDKEYLDENDSLTFTMKHSNNEVKSNPTLLSWRVNFITNQVTPVKEGK